MPNVWPVIHVKDAQQALGSAVLASRVGAHGVFLIQMEGNDVLMDPIAEKIRSGGLGLKLGVNYLSLPATEALQRAISLGYDASWSDNPGVRSDKINQTAQSCASIISGFPHHRFFASVAFKYQKPEPDPPAAARRALELGFTPTTSGAATGIAPQAEKVKQIHASLATLPSFTFALASGVDPSNVSYFAPHLTDILVSSGISSDFYTFSESLLSSLIKKAALQ